MKSTFLLTALSLIFTGPLFSQQKNVDTGNHYLDKYLGVYGNQVLATEKFIIKKENDHLVLAIPGQGQTDLQLVDRNTYRVKLVRPAATINFIEDSLGEATIFLWLQNLNMVWLKIADTSSSLAFAKENLAEYTGRYKMDAYKTIAVKIKNEHLVVEIIDAEMQVASLDLLLLSPDRFTLKSQEGKQVFQFVRNKSGAVEKIKVTRTGSIRFSKISKSVIDSSFATNFANRENGFSRADSLRGMLTSLRSCYDVTFYGLDVSIDPETKFIHGTNLIRFKATEPFKKMQVDLYSNMKIEKILYHNQPIPYSREYNAVFIEFPSTIKKESEEEISFFYSGSPQTPHMASLSGGFFWGADHNGKPWIESVCQGAGASLWWPCKDHLSDKPDSMKISITVPHDLTEISNGRLIDKTDLAGNLTRFDWRVSYPINTYNVAINIGDYTHFSDLFTNGMDTVLLNYYCLTYNKDKAEKIFAHVKPMLELYEKKFGGYPFAKDGFTLMESLYPMEHQGAVTFGPINNPINTNRYDSTDLIRTAWHESAHEWWGNSITCRDNADLWIHEAFATYSEVLCYETFQGKDAALRYLKSEQPANKKAIIGVYNVNDFHLGDMYSKGALMLHTLRNILNNDSLWFAILKGLQRDLKYRAVTSEDIISYFNKSTHKNLTPIFDQYLRHSAIPQLSLIFKKSGDSLQVQYKWVVDVVDFEMPVKVTTGKDRFEFIYPTSSWQTVYLPGMKYKNFKVDTNDFYITLDKEKLY